MFGNCLERRSAGGDLQIVTVKYNELRYKRIPRATKTLGLGLCLLLGLESFVACFV